MCKLIKGYRQSTPENPESGYGDRFELYDGSALLYGNHFSSCPDPYKIAGHIPWRACFAMLAFQSMSFTCLADDPGKKFGKCLQFNGGGPCMTVNPNSNQQGAYQASSVYWHRGAIHSDNKLWRASTCCCTIHPDIADEFFSYFDIGEKGKFTLEAFIEGNLT